MKRYKVLYRGKPIAEVTDFDEGFDTVFTNAEVDIVELENKCCLACKWAELTEDDFDVSNMVMGGKRLVFECTHWYDQIKKDKHDREDMPLMSTVIERESVPSMKKETSFMATFWCCYWKQGE